MALRRHQPLVKGVVMQRWVEACLCLLLVPTFTMARQPQDSWENLKQLRPGQKLEVVDVEM